MSLNPTIVKNGRPALEAELTRLTTALAAAEAELKEAHTALTDEYKIPTHGNDGERASLDDRICWLAVGMHLETRAAEAAIAKENSALKRAIHARQSAESILEKDNEMLAAQCSTLRAERDNAVAQVAMCKGALENPASAIRSNDP